jgi:hypothetical protein
MISKLTLLPLLLISSLSFSAEEIPQWYAGITAGLNHTDSDTLGDPDTKYGIKGGYILNHWLAVESEFILHNNESNRFCDSTEFSNVCVTLKQEYNYGFIGLRATKPIGNVFAFTARLGGALANYDSSLTGSESKFNVSGSLGMLWNISQNSQLTFELQQVDYALANKAHENIISQNLSFTMKF